MLSFTHILLDAATHYRFEASWERNVCGVLCVCVCCASVGLGLVRLFSRMDNSEGLFLIACSWHDLPNSAPTLPFQNKAWQPKHSTNRVGKECFTDPTVQALKRVQSGLDLEFRALYSKHCKLPPFLQLNLECSCPPCRPCPT